MPMRRAMTRLPLSSPGRDLAGLRWPHLAFGAALEEAYTHLAFHRPQAARDRGRIDAQPAAGGGEGAFAAQRQHMAQIVPVDIVHFCSFARQLFGVEL